MTKIQRACPLCKELFNTLNKQQTFCTEKCRQSFNNLKLKQRKAKEKLGVKSNKYFKFEDYHGNIIV